MTIGDISAWMLGDDDAGDMDLVLDLAGCDPHTIASRDDLVRFAAELCNVIGARAFGLPVAVRFAPGDPAASGYRLVQLTNKASIVGRFVEASGTARINILSGERFNPEPPAAFAAEFFAAKQTEQKVLIRR